MYWGFDKEFSWLAGDGMDGLESKYTEDLGRFVDEGSGNRDSLRSMISSD